MSRVTHVKKNIFYGYISTILVSILGFVSRTVFLSVLNTSYLGVNGLFTNILGVLSFAELGIGTAMNHALYKPVAENNLPKIKSLMQFYKKAYRIIAIIVAGIGLTILPFLDIIVKDPGNVGNISLYFAIFLFNTVSTYFVSYKLSLVNAEQKNYIVTNIDSVVNTITTVVNIIVLLVFKNFLYYLLSTSIIGLVRRTYLSMYLNKRYQYLLEKNVNKITKEELTPIKNNISALFFHKLGSIAVHQTDNIIISSFINIATVGILANYTLLKTTVAKFIDIIFNSAVGSFGNLIATSDANKQYETYKVYRFLAFWIYGFSCIALYILSSPFISIWLKQPSLIINDTVILLIMINYYMEGHRKIIVNVKSAAGIFQQDKYIAIIQSVLNLVVSIIGVKLIGLPGVFIGTIAQGLLSTIAKPIILYKALFNKPSIEYFITSLKYLVPVVIAGGICYYIKQNIFNSGNVLDFIYLTLITAFIPNVLFFICFFRSKEFKKVKNINFKKIA